MQAVKKSVPSLASLARHLGITRGAIAQWDRVPAERIFVVARFTGLSPEVIRPDLYEGDQEAAE